MLFRCPPPPPQSPLFHGHSPFEPARMVPETAPPALTMAAEDVILETVEATSVAVPENAMRTSKGSKQEPNLWSELEF